MRPDNRLNDAPMVPVACSECGAHVLARKSSWEQTSVQWSSAAMAQCTERRRASEHPTFVGAILRPGMFLACPQLRASIDAAAGAGSLPVLDEL
ncbi:ferredoxin [Mycolicibacter algericus]|uniref:ferredoxin n=1 Tax=Mycolicibacter algericus TaxID=1288388 RepID=UPI003C7290E5